MGTFFNYGVFMINGKSLAAEQLREVYYVCFSQSAQLYPEKFGKFSGISIKLFV